MHSSAPPALHHNGYLEDDRFVTAFAQSSLAVQACQLVLACPCWLHAQYLTWLAPAFAKQHHGQYYSQNQQAQ